MSNNDNQMNVYDFLQALISFERRSEIVAENIGEVLNSHKEQIDEHLYNFIYHAYSIQSDKLSLRTWINTLTYLPPSVIEEILNNNGKVANSLWLNSVIIPPRMLDKLRNKLKEEDLSYIFQRQDILPQTINYIIHNFDKISTTLYRSYQLEKEQIIYLLEKMEKLSNSSAINDIVKYQKNIPHNIFEELYQKYSQKPNNFEFKNMLANPAFPRDLVLDGINNNIFNDDLIITIINYNRQMKAEDWSAFIRPPETLSTYGPRNSKTIIYKRLVARQPLADEEYHKILQAHFSDYQTRENINSLLNNPRLSPSGLSIILQHINYCNGDNKIYIHPIANRKLPVDIILDIYNHKCFALQKNIMQQLKNIPTQNLADIYSKTTSKLLKSTIINFIKDRPEVQQHTQNVKFLKLNTPSSQTVQNKVYDRYLKNLVKSTEVNIA